MVLIAERQIHPLTGYIAQLVEARLVLVQEQLCSQFSREASRPQGHRRPPYKYHVLPHESKLLKAQKYYALQYFAYRYKSLPVPQGPQL